MQHAQSDCTQLPTLKNSNNQWLTNANILMKATARWLLGAGWPIVLPANAQMNRNTQLQRHLRIISGELTC